MLATLALTDCVRVMYCVPTVYSTYVVMIVSLLMWAVIACRILTPPSRIHSDAPRIQRQKHKPPLPIKKILFFLHYHWFTLLNLGDLEVRGYCGHGVSPATQKFQAKRGKKNAFWMTAVMLVLQCCWAVHNREETLRGINTVLDLPFLWSCRG